MIRAFNFKYKDLPIKKKLLLVLYILIIIPMVVVGIMSYNISSHAMVTKAYETAHDMLSLVRYNAFYLLTYPEKYSIDIEEVCRQAIVKSISPDLESGLIQDLTVLDSKNGIIYTSNIKTGQIDKEKQYPGIEGYLIDKQNSLIEVYAPLVPGLKIVSNIPLLKVYHDVYDLRDQILWTCLFTLIAISVLGWLAASDIVKPINKMVRQMSRMQAGESSAAVDVDRNDELGYLQKAYNKMIDDIAHLMNNIYREQITRKEAELKALQTQMNPHFLFNTLESVNWMAQMNNIPEISDTVTNLSALIEAGIGRDSRLITLQEEFSYIDQYISIIKTRYGDKLEFKVNLCETVMLVQIPRLLIQPIIENAVYHGIEQVRRKGVIELAAFSYEGKLVITVYDNGAGIPEDELTVMRGRLGMNDDEYFRMIGKKGKSIGIENVNRRIKLFYGQEYGLKIESDEEEFTRITVTIPMEIKKDMEGFYVQSDDN